MRSAFFPLLVKESQQLLRNTQLMFIIFFPPIFQLWLFCSALDPEPKNVQVAMVDSSPSVVSRQLADTIANANVFTLVRGINSDNDALRAVQSGEADVAVIVPPKFNSQIQGRTSAPVQVVSDGVDANTAGIVNAYFEQMFLAFSQRLGGMSGQRLLNPQITFMYNPGLKASWFFVPGIAGTIVTVIGLVLAASCFIREKDTGTLDQLLMTPATSFEIIMAKIIPNLVGLSINLALAAATGSFFFGMPMRGNVLYLVLVSVLYLLVTISIGMTTATFARNQMQAILTSFFISIPMVQTSGAITPIENTPIFLQQYALFNPLFHYHKALMAIVLRGAGFDVILPHVLALIAFAVGLMAIGSHQFRRQLD